MCMNNINKHKLNYYLGGTAHGTSSDVTIMDTGTQM